MGAAFATAKVETFANLESRSYSVLAGVTRVCSSLARNSASLFFPLKLVARLAQTEAYFCWLNNALANPVLEALSADDVRKLIPLLTEGHSRTIGLLTTARRHRWNNPAISYLLRKIEQSNNELSGSIEYFRSLVERDEPLQVLRLSERDQIAIADSLRNPPPANARLKELGRRYSTKAL